MSITDVILRMAMASIIHLAFFSQICYVLYIAQFQFFLQRIRKKIIDMQFVQKLYLNLRFSYKISFKRVFLITKLYVVQRV